MKTLLITSDPLSDPVPVRSDAHPMSAGQALVDALRKRGDHVRILHDTPKKKNDSVIRPLGFSRASGFGLALKAFSERNEYDFILTQDKSVGLPLALMLRNAQSRPQHIFIGEAIASDDSLLPFAGQVLFNALDLQQGYDLLFVNSEAERDFLEDKLGVLWDKIVLTPPPVDDMFFQPRPSAVGQPDQVLAIIGAGQRWSAFAEAARDLPNLSVIPIIPGNCDAVEMRKLYAACAFVVVPQDATQSFAGAVLTLQAMAMGKAVLAAKSESGSDTVLDGVTGLTIAHDDIDGWRTGLARLHSDAALRERLGRNARRWIEEHAAQERWSARVAGVISHTPLIRQGNVSSPPDAYMTTMRGFG